MSDALIPDEILPPVVQDITPGRPLADVLDECVPAHLRHHPGLVVYSQGTELADPASYTIREGDHILVGLRPLGGGDGHGKSIGQIVVGIVLIVVGALTSWAGGTLLIQAGIGLVIGGLAGLLIKPPSLGKQNFNTDRDSAYYGITGQSNAARPYQSVLKLYGQHRMFPALAANPVIYNSGTVSTISAIYDFGIGHVSLSELKIGDTPADVFTPELRYYTNALTIEPELATRRVSYQSFAYVLQPGEPLSLTTAPNTQWAMLDIAFAQGLFASTDTGDNVNTEVEFDAWYSDGVNTWPITADMVIAWPANAENTVGLSARTRQVPTGTSSSKSWIDDGWVQLVRTLIYQGQYKSEDSFIWRGVGVGSAAAGNPLVVSRYGYNNAVLRRGPASGPDTWRLQVTATTPDYVNASGFIVGSSIPKPQIAALQIQFPTPGQYTITLNRITPISTDYRVQNTATVSQLKSFTTGGMFALRHPHTMVEMRVQGSEKLSGVVQNLSALAISVLPTYDASGNYVEDQATRNPAWCALDVLIGEANPQPIPHSMIDWPSWYAFAQYCAAPRTWIINGQSITSAAYLCDVVIDYMATVKDVVESILTSARASLVVTQSGKYGVLIDQVKSTPRQVITPANSFSFAAVRSFLEPLHAFRVTFNDATRNYQPQEIYVYADGYSLANATKIEALTTFGMTDYAHAWAWGRYMLAQRELRAESFTVKMDAEHLAVQRGDLVFVAHDVPQIGGQACRVVSRAGNTITVDNNFGTAPTSYTVRLQDGSVRQGTVASVVDESTFILDSAGDIYADDLIVLGIASRVTRPYLIDSIAPEADMVATLSLAAYDPAIYEADQGALPPYDPGFGDDLINASNLAVTSVTITSALYYDDRFPNTRVYIAFQVNSPFYAYAEILLRHPDGSLELVDTARGVLTGVHEFAMVGSEVAKIDPLNYVVQPYTAGGLPGTPGVGSIAQLAIPLPPPPERFDLDLKRDTLGASWDHPSDSQAIVGYEIRYDPAFLGSDIRNATIILRNIAYPTTSTELPTRLGTYYIKSVDALGRRSSGYAVSFTPGENLWNLNVIANWNDAPGWGGQRYGFDIIEGRLASQQVSPGVFVQRAEYYYATQYDGGEIYQTRLTSQINVAALYANSFMAGWVPLAAVDPIAGAPAAGAGSGQVGEFIDVWHEVRWTSTSQTMVTWVPLASANPIGLGHADFGPWRRFYVGDYTARYFQFRLVAEYIGPAQYPDVGAEIRSAQVDIDMPDRTDAHYDVAAGAAGLDVQYVPAFKARPAVSIGIDNGASGDTYTLTNQSRFGFSVRFYNAGAAVARHFDWMAKGYGAQSDSIPQGRHARQL